MYKTILRPLLFKTDPEKIHTHLINRLKMIEHSVIAQKMTHSLYAPQQRQLHKVVNGIQFMNPIGLSAGFDKNGEAFRALGSFGFGFVEIGTITTEPQIGNPKPRVFRLPKDDALISRTGFNNDGLEMILPRIRCLRDDQLVVGANINKNPSTIGAAVIEEFYKLFSTLYPYVDYFTINLTYPMQGMLLDSEGKWLIDVFRKLDDYRRKQREHHPIYVKIPADLTEVQLMDVGETIIREHIEGVVATGPTMKRDGFISTPTDEVEACGIGGVSGHPLKKRSLEVVRFLRKQFGTQFTIIGTGGIMNAEDSVEMMQAGADLIELYSAFIYSGPGVLKEIGNALTTHNVVHLR